MSRRLSILIAYLGPTPVFLEHGDAFFLVFSSLWLEFFYVSRVPPPNSRHTNPLHEGPLSLECVPPITTTLYFPLSILCSVPCPLDRNYK